MNWGLQKDGEFSVLMDNLHIIKFLDKGEKSRLAQTDMMQLFGRGVPSQFIIVGITDGYTILRHSPRRLPASPCKHSANLL